MLCCIIVSKQEFVELKGIHSLRRFSGENCQMSLMKDHVSEMFEKFSSENLLKLCISSMNSCFDTNTFPSFHAMFGIHVPRFLGICTFYRKCSAF